MFSNARRNQNHATIQLAESYHQLYHLLSSPLPDVGSYAIVEQIGEGSFGKVYLAYHKLTRSKVVLKSADKSNPNVIREIHYQRQFHHVHICRLFEIVVTENSVWMVMEYCPNNELYNYLVSNRKLSILETRRIFSQIVGAVGYIHSQECSHRDLKLENVLLDGKMNVKLTDFGFTRECDKGLLESICGTTSYMAPELLTTGGYYGPQIDMWSLGVILYALVTGEMPFDDENDDDTVTKLRIVNKEPDYPEWLPDDLTDLLKRLLSKNGPERPTALEVLNSPFLQPDGQKQIKILKSPEKVHFSTKLEKNQLSLLRKMHVDVDRIMKSVNENTCDYYSALWFLLLEKDIKSLKRRKRRDGRKKQSDMDTETSDMQAKLQSFELSSDKNDHRRSNSDDHQSILSSIKGNLTLPVSLESARKIGQSIPVLNNVIRDDSNGRKNSKESFSSSKQHIAENIGPRDGSYSGKMSDQNLKNSSSGKSNSSLSPNVLEHTNPPEGETKDELANEYSSNMEPEITQGSFNKDDTPNEARPEEGNQQVTFETSDKHLSTTEKDEHSYVRKSSYTPSLPFSVGDAASTKSMRSTVSSRERMKQKWSKMKFWKRRKDKDSKKRQNAMMGISAIQRRTSVEGPEREVFVPEAVHRSQDDVTDTPVENGEKFDVDGPFEKKDIDSSLNSSSFVIVQPKYPKDTRKKELIEEELKSRPMSHMDSWSSRKSDIYSMDSTFSDSASEEERSNSFIRRSSSPAIMSSRARPVSIVSQISEVSQISQHSEQSDYSTMSQSTSNSQPSVSNKSSGNPRSLYMGGKRGGPGTKEMYFSRAMSPDYGKQYFLRNGRTGGPKYAVFPGDSAVKPTSPTLSRMRFRKQNSTRQASSRSIIEEEVSVCSVISE